MGLAAVPSENKHNFACMREILLLEYNRMKSGSLCLEPDP